MHTPSLVQFTRSSVDISSIRSYYEIIIIYIYNTCHELNIRLSMVTLEYKY